MINNLTNIFASKFNTAEKPLIYFAPGRINIIGEHIDYNEGFVLPAAINLGTYAVVSLRNDDLINLVSHNFTDCFEVNKSDLQYYEIHNWANYPKGVMFVLAEAGYKISQGFNVLFYGNLPNRAGLSSSASIELATAVMLNDLFDFKIKMLDLVKFALEAENHYIRLNCGIMDQFAIGMGKKNNAILLNSQSLEYEYIPMNLGDYNFVITNTMKKRNLVDSKFNERQNECIAALNIIQKELNVNNLCQLNLADYQKIEHLLTDENLKKRVLHVISENIRTIEATQKLKNNDLQALGELLNQSNLSLKNNYEVTGFELDTLQAIAVKQKGVLGSRMTGAGFGGCNITLISKDCINDFIKIVKIEYSQKTGLIPEFIIMQSDDGARKIAEEYYHGN